MTVVRGASKLARLTKGLAVAAVLTMLAGPATAAVNVGEQAPGTGAKGRHVALVIGNGAYAAAALANPPNDARLVSNALAGFGFEVHRAEDLSTGGFDDFMKAMAPRIEKADVLFVYYAGHAFQYRGDNRLLMTDASFGSMDAVLKASVSISALIARLSKLNPGMLVLALDSCRDNPFAKDKEGVEQGLSYVETGSGQLMIAYATSAGQVAYDGDAGNSPYAVALSNSLDASDDGSLTEVFRDVRRMVREATNGVQIPWVSSSVESDIVLARAEEPAIVVGAAPAVDSGLPTIEEVVWHFVRSSPDPDDLKFYVDTFPKGVYVADARGLIQLRETATRGVGNVDAFVQSVSERAPPEVRLSDDVVLATTGDRTPAPELRTWPRKLPPGTPGLAMLAGDCDRLSADPDDPGRLSPGLPMGRIAVRAAIRACALAVVANPEEPRLLFQVGRILDAARLYSWAIAYYEEAGKRGYSAALVNHGYLHRIGRGVPQDYPKAFDLYRRAALLGNLRGRTNLGSMFREGWGVEKNYEEAMLWYRLAGSTGWPNAINALANMHAAGEGTPKSPETAVRLYEIAAEAGNTDALNSLGQAYLNGRGVPKDIDRAVAYLEQGVAVGNRFATRTLGVHLMKRDPKRAEQLLLFSAERNNQAARLDLARLYDGRGETEEAYFQARIAGELGQKDARAMLDKIEPKLKADQREKVETRVRRWLALNGV